MTPPTGRFRARARTPSLHPISDDTKEADTDMLTPRTRPLFCIRTHITPLIPNHTSLLSPPTRRFNPIKPYLMTKDETDTDLLPSRKRRLVCTRTHKTPPTPKPHLPYDSTYTKTHPPNPSLMTKVESDTTVKASDCTKAQLRRRLIPLILSLIALTLACTRGRQNTYLGSGDKAVLLPNHTFPTTPPTRRLIPPIPSLTALTPT